MTATLAPPSDQSAPPVGMAFGALRQETEGFAQFSDSLLDELDEIRYSLFEQEEMLGEREAKLTLREQVLQHSQAKLKEEQRMLESSTSSASHLTDDLAQKKIALEAEQLSTLKMLDQAQQELANLQKDAVESKSHEEQAMELSQERDALEAELEEVRRHTAKLSDTVSEIREASSQEQVDHATEIEELRHEIEIQKQQLAQVKATKTRNDLTKSELRNRHHPESPLAEETPTTSGVPDSAVGSVMAQFAKLQEDAAKRRSRRVQTDGTSNRKKKQ